MGPEASLAPEVDHDGPDPELWGLFLLVWLRDAAAPEALEKLRQFDFEWWLNVLVTAARQRLRINVEFV